MTSTPTETTKADEEAGKSRPVGRLKLILRLLLYGLPLLLLINMLYAVFMPVSKPQAVVKIEHERQNPMGDRDAIDPPERPVATSPTNHTLAAKPPERSLFSEVPVPPPLQSEITQWDAHYHSFVNEMTAYEQKAAGLAFNDAYRRIQDLFGKLWDLSKQIDIAAHNKLAGMANPPDSDAWGKFTTPVFKEMQSLWGRLAEDMLENFVRHKRWVAAARFCEASLHDSAQAGYYWRQWGGRQGLFQAAVLSIGRPWDAIIVHSHRGIYWAHVKRGYFSSPIDDEANWAPNPVFGPTPFEGRLPYL